MEELDKKAAKAFPFDATNANPTLRAIVSLQREGFKVGYKATKGIEVPTQSNALIDDLNALVQDMETVMEAKMRYGSQSDVVAIGLEVTACDIKSIREAIGVLSGR